MLTFVGGYTRETHECLGSRGQTARPLPDACTDGTRREDLGPKEMQTRRLPQLPVAEL